MGTDCKWLDRNLGMGYHVCNALFIKTNIYICGCCDKFEPKEEIEYFSKKESK